MKLAAQMGFEARTVVIRETASGDRITSCLVDPKDVTRNTSKKSSLARALEKIIFNKFSSPARPGPEWPRPVKSKPIAMAVVILVGRKEYVLVRLPLRLTSSERSEYYFPSILMAEELG